MARKPRVHFPGALYHVISRGNQRQAVFLRETDYQTYLGYLGEYKARHSFYLYAYVFMKNHVHLLVEVRTVPLSRIMQVLQFRYARYFNRRYHKVGHLFQGRYKAIVCDKDSYLLELVRYIHLNPVRAKIVPVPETYLWSSHRHYLGKEKTALVDTQFVLSQYHRNLFLARLAYRKFMEEGLQEGHQEKYYRVKEQQYLADDEWIQQLERGVPPEQARYEIPLEQISAEVAKALGVRASAFYSLSRERRAALGRGVVGYLARKWAGVSLKHIADHFHRDPATLSEAMTKVEALIAGNAGFKTTVERLERRLTKKAKQKYRITKA